MDRKSNMGMNTEKKYDTVSGEFYFYDEGLL
jgi:hypothetical protein